MTDKIGRLSRLGFRSLAECLLSAPKEYRDYLEPLHILPIPDTGIKHYLVLTLTEKTLYDKQRNVTSLWKNASRLVMRGVDGRGDGISITVFGSVWPWKEFKLGDELHLFGEVTTWEGRRQLNNPDLVLASDRGRVVPLYQGKPGQVKGELLSQAVAQALPMVNDASCMLLEQAGMRESDFRNATGFNDPADLIRMLHLPPSVREGAAAVDTARSLSLKAILNRAIRNQSHQPVAGSSIAVDRDKVGRLVAALPYPLTLDQAKAIDEIVADLRSPFPMRRLLSGDVGTGKSVTFMVPAVAAHLEGARIAIIAPSQLLVEQLAGEIRQLFPGTPVCEVVSGSKIGEGIVVGTTAVISAAKKSAIQFDLVVADEQHRFSVDQKASLLASHTNFLEATATAIPRTLALVQFGGVAVSILRECPVTKRVRTRIVNRKDGGRLFDFVYQQIQEGGQVAVIYPLAEDKGDGDRSSVEAAYARFHAKWGDRVGMLHGKLSDDEKNTVIAKMKAGGIDILVSSTVIEVGITLPSLRAVVVVNADRFGVSQLHQLRGRVARKGGDGFFFLYLPEDAEDDAMARLRLVAECNDGFTLAERDADLRGFGDVESSSDAQTGNSRLLFWGVTIERKEIESGARSMGLVSA
ncbi:MULTISPECIES: helicase-related protein [Caballeronia]|uniref:helicase-related protein n=1 Tax=Caballeronia TaxID=1827195 RepID=UPI001FD48013|nr:MULTISPECIES: helicase-related protein [Caballeronia]MDR5799246.1 helicase-related protein [Caballeronia sp. LZ001]